MSGAPELPDSWLGCTLGGVINYGATAKVAPAAIPADAWILELEDIERDTSRVLTRATCAERQSKSTKHRFAAGDVLYGKLRPYLNKVIRADRPGFCTTEIVPLRPPAGLAGGYLFHWLKHPRFRDYVSAVSHGLSMPRLGPAAAAAAPFVLAPLREQQRIADKLDTLLARSAACRARLERVPDLLHQLRQSVLTAATSGALTAAWRTAQGEHAAWERCALGELIAQGPKNGLYKPSAAYGEGTRILRIDNFYDGWTRPFCELKRLQLTAQERADYALARGDIVINRVNSLPLLGKAALIRDLPEPCVFESNMMRLRLDPRRILPTYAILVLTSPHGVAQLRRHAKHAVNQASINQRDVGRVEMPLPGLREQQEIVRRAEALLSATARLAARREKALQTLADLTPALLAKAFRGALVPQDPGDEPASAVLARIQHARAAGRGSAVTPHSAARSAAAPR